MQIIVREAKLEDAKEIESIHLKYYSEIGQISGVIETNFYRDSCIFLAAVAEDGEVVGYLIASVSETSSYAEWIGVKYEDLRIGSALGQHYFDECKKRNIRLVSVTTRNRFQKALINYIKQGFEIYGTYLALDGDVMIQLRKHLGEN